MIKGLTDDITPRYARIGKLRKGGEKTSNGYGEDLDHFRFVSPYPEVSKAFAKAYPGKPREIKVFIPHDTVDSAFPTWCELWSKTGLVHRCDGVTMNIWRDGNKYARGEKPCTGGHKDNDPKKDSVGRLEFVIPQMVEAGFVGYITLETHSLHDIMNISRVLSAVYKSAGTLAGVEFVLRRVKENIGVPGWGDRKNDRARADKWLVRLEPSPEWVQRILLSQKTAAMQIASPKPALIESSVGIVDSETGEILDETKPQSANADIVDPVTGDMWTNTSNFKSDTLTKWHSLVEEAYAAGVVMDFNLTEEDTKATVQERAGFIRNAIEAKKQAQAT